MKKVFFTLSLLVGLCLCANAQTKAPHVKNELRAPAYPLITIDPYTSGWSFTDKLTDQNVKHWTGREFPLLGAIRVDNQVYRFMGIENKVYSTIAPISTEAAWSGKYTFTKPEEGWLKQSFNDSDWKTGEAAFGTQDETNTKTRWTSKDIWVRRSINVDPSTLKSKKIFLKYSHDDTFELYINGIQVVKTGYEWHKDVMLELKDDVKKAIADGKIVIAAHCHNQTGGGLVDFGIYAEEEVEKHLDRAAQQKAVDVQATQTHYTFTCGKVELKVSFIAPMLMDNLYLTSRPINYIVYDVKSLDGLAHDVQVYFEAAPVWALDRDSQANKGIGYEKDGLLFVKTGSNEQKILAKSGDDVRIDWGYFYMSAGKLNASTAVGNSIEMRNAFAKNGKLSGDVKSKDNASLAIAQSLGRVKTASGKVLIGFDDIYSIQYFGDNIRPYWNKDGMKTIESAIVDANKEFVSLKNKCTVFDNDLMKKAIDVGGKEYAELCALAYRQAISAHKLIEAPNGDLVFLSKENFSNGSIGTVDVTYPSAPLFLYYNPELAKALLNHIFYYSESGRWTKPFAAHDIGTYPIGNGQTYGGDMPVEESGNMLILTAAIANVEGNAKYAEKHWEVLTTWANYLIEKGLDPENQLCTDDFAGHFAHNTNLSIKAIMGVASYGYLAKMQGKNAVAEQYTGKAKEMAKEWVKMANDGDHFRLTFDKSGTWSQKYNLVWDKLFGWDIFSSEIVNKEIPFYLSKQNKYGLPLDNRNSYTKSDWIIWTATLAKDKQTFEQFIKPIHLFMGETIDRIPMTDWYFTDNTKHTGFRARSVVGGYYIKMLEEKLNRNKK